MRLFLLTFLLTIFYLMLTSAVYAAGEFSISYDNLYEVDNNSNLNVTQNVKITNLTTQFYAAEFTISIGNVKVEKVTAADESGPISAEVNFSGKESSIKLKFNTPVVGKGQVKNFSLKYLANEFVNKTGQILEVSIPKLATEADIDQFNVTLLVPASAGPAAFITPEPVSVQLGGFGGRNKYFFDKSQLTKSGIAAAFGEKQVFSFQLIYHLANSKNVKTEIAIPADNPYQKIYIAQIEPQPIDTRVDSDGNWLALYELDAGKQKEVKVLGFAQVYPRPQFKIDSFDGVEKYLSPQQYWEVNDDYFVRKAAELKTPKQIYDFVTSFLSYNQDRLTAQTVKRIGAAGAVKAPKNAVCMEFTDLFITLARAAGIPAREVNGFAVSSNERLRPLSLRNFGGDILHAWPEYWDANSATWVQVDPTWGATSGGLDYFSKMDFNHIAFVHKGLSSTNPVPAGGYKTDPGQVGDVRVEVTTNLPKPTFEPRLSIDIPQNLLSGLTTNGMVIITNLSNQAIVAKPLRISAKNLSLATPTEIDLGVLPPFAQRIVDLEVAAEGLLTNKTGEIQATFGPLTASAKVSIRPSLFFGLILLAGGGIVFTGSVFGSILIFKKFIKPPHIRSE